MSTLKTVSIEEISANPYRNFDIYPMDEAQVEALMESYEQASDFGVLPIRRSEYANTMYEQAAGHHRLEAMRRLGHGHIQVIIGQYDDDDMVKIMALENARQKGDNAPAQLDALAGIAQRVAFLMLVSEDVSQLAQICADFEGMSDKQLKDGRAKLLSGTGVSRNVIQMYAPSVWKEKPLQILLTTLKDSGQMGKIIELVQAEVAEITEAENEAERERVEAAEKAKKRQAKLEAEAKLQALKAQEAAKKATAARKKQADADARVAADNAKKLATARVKAQKEEEKKRAKAADAAAKRRVQLEEAAASRKAFEEKSRGLNPEVLHMLKRDDHLETFRKVVVANQAEFPKHEQPMLVQEMLSMGKLTSVIIGQYLNNVLEQRNSLRRQLAAEEEGRKELKSVVTKVNNTVDGFRADIGRAGRSIREVAKLLDSEKHAGYAFSHISADMQLVKNIDALESAIGEFRKQLNLRTFAVSRGVTIESEVA